MRLGVIGCGKMGTAWVAGAIRAGVVDASQVHGVDPHPGARDHFAETTGAAVSPDLADLDGCGVLLLCTKPHDAPAALATACSGPSGSDRLVISIAAGVTLATLAEAAPGARLIRAMPNTPAMIGKGAAAFSTGPGAGAEDAAQARALLGSVGLAVEVPERLLNAVTGLSGSGPAYVYLIIEALADGGVRCGLPRSEALTLAAQTVLGSAAMVLETGMHPAVLKDMVTSPGGTTIAALATMERHGLRAALIDGVEAATTRARELGG